MKSRKIVIVILIIFIIILFSGCTKKSEEDMNIEKKVEEKLSNMSLDEKIGQMLIIFYKGDKVDSTLKSSLESVKPGGMIFFTENFTSYNDTLKLVKDVKATSDIPMFISVDQEGGKVQRLIELEDKEVTRIPAMYYLGKMNDLKLTKNVGKVIGEELRTLGFNMDFAPVMDIYENKDNTVIGKRSFGETAEMVSKQALALGEGLKGTGIIPVYKHFPGHGNTSVDSHYDLPVVTKTKEELLKDDLIPFMDAIKNGEEVIMIGHLAVPSITKDNTPASLSRDLITGLLKEELGYKGLVITDALNMGALTNTYSQEEIYIKAINAGVDLLLMPSGSKSALKSIREAVDKGLISEDTINNSVKKILTLKYKRIEKDYDNYLDDSYLNSKEHQDIVNKVITE
jgi:beta-N-acetylhexosaminidase